MKKIEIFGDDIDYIIPSVIVAVPIYVFYGGYAMWVPFPFIIAFANAKPLKNLGYDRSALSIIATGIVCIMSIFLKFIFREGYCYHAPWALFTYMFGGQRIDGQCFNYGIFTDINYDGVKGYIRDIGIPIIGMSLCWHGYKQRTLS